MLIATQSPSPPTDLPTRDQRARALLNLLRLSEVAIWVDATGLHARPLALLHEQTRDELTDLKSELTELLKTEGVEDVFTVVSSTGFTVDADAVVTNATPPRPAAEVDADARAANKAAARRREYQSGMVVVSPVDRPSNNYGAHVARIVRNRDGARQSGTKCWSPGPGYTAYKFDLFNRGDDE
jgi:hypothetical protein